jgi:hypothetical protein
MTSRQRKTHPPYLVDNHVYDCASFFVECEALDDPNRFQPDDIEYHVWELAKQIQDVIENYDYN